MSSNQKNKKSSNKNNPKGRDSQAAKKEAVFSAGNKKNSKALTIGAVICLVVLLGGAGVYLQKRSSTTTTPKASVAVLPATAAVDTPATAAQPDVRTFAALDFEDGKARHYDLETDDGVNIRFFVVKSTDGVIRAAFDACDVCWRAGKGYYQKEDDMICRNCGRKFPTQSINEVKGGCNPAPLKRTIKDGQVEILVEDIQKGRSYFDL